jgi:HAE1 family hydrophobic/amphiphilic exporter-1
LSIEGCPRVLARGASVFGPRLARGTIANQKQQIALESNDDPQNAAQFRQIIIADPDGHPVRLGDVANVKDSVAKTLSASTFDGQPAIVLAVFRQPGLTRWQWSS